MEKQDFINLIKDGAINAEKKFGICASLTIAQAIIESGWGKYAPGNNIFGIKWTENCGYRSQSLSTQEYINGSWKTIVAIFRAYDSINDSLYDHAQFLCNNSRYKNLLGVKDYKTACRLIQEDGYATDPNYSALLINIIEENKLYIYDTWEVKKVKSVVVYTNEIDKRACEYLADYLRCSIISRENVNSILDDAENIYVVGGDWKPVDKAILISGIDRYETVKSVLKYIGKL